LTVRAMVGQTVMDQAMTLEQADLLLDEAWANDGDVAHALETAKRLSVEVGRDPVIEDAKLFVARANGCSPSEAFQLMVKISQNTNRKVAVIAQLIVESRSMPEQP
jgi:AmiR/NasT family two-component response regulator